MANRRGTLRIIGGQWRGRRLPIIEASGLRPTPDRVRETLFNWLQAEIPGSHCLDLFAGTGALAFEALSRGAERVTVVESNSRACDQIRASAAALGTDRLNLICADVSDFLRQSAEVFTGTETGSAPAPSWDLVFVDPPYKLGYPPPQWPLIGDHPRIADDAAIYMESHADHRDTPLTGTTRRWRERRHKVAGEICYRLLEPAEPPIPDQPPK